MTLFIIIAIFIAFVIAIVATDRNKVPYEERQKMLATGMFGGNQPDDDQLLQDIETKTRRIQAFIQAELVGDINTSSAINSGNYHGPLPERRDDGGWLSIYDNLRILNIASINHRQGIGRYTGRVECALVHEPDNEFDPDAIKIVASDRHHLGYVPSVMTDFVRSLVRDQFPYRCTAFIDSKEDEDDGHHFFVGHIYVVRK